MPLIETEFDGLLEDDMILEETDQALDYAQILKNSENILKSFLYLKKIADGSSPFINAVTKMDTVDTGGDKIIYTVNAETGLVVIKNVSSVANGSIFFNDGEFVLFPFESIEFPVLQTSKLELNGAFSILESEYKIGK